MLTWAPVGEERAILGAVRLPKGKPLNRQVFLQYLAKRVQEMANEADEGELAEAQELAHRGGLLDDSVPLERNLVGLLLVEENSVVKELLDQLRVPGRELPQKLERSNPQAESVYEETSLVQWLLPLLRGRYERD
jgi:hypothetical protein